jgi:hypothetical protein
MPIDAIVPTFINAPDDVSEPAYDAEELRRSFGGLVTNTSGSATVARSGALDLRALAPSLSGSNVQVGAGPCVVGTAKGAYLSGMPQLSNVDALVAADATNPRRDRVVFEILDPDNGGSTARKARVRVIAGAPNTTALTGGGYPADPGAADGVSAFFDIAYVDVPKVGGGSPALVDIRPFTAAAGAPVIVRNQGQRDAITAAASQVLRADRAYRRDWRDANGWQTNPVVISDNGDATPVLYGVQHNVTLDSQGVGIITFTQPFPTKFSSIGFTRENTTGTPTDFMTLNGGGYTTNRFQVTILCTDGATGAPITGLVYVYVTANGH